MSKKDNHITEPFKLTVFRSFEEMKSATFSASHAPRLKKTNKKTLK